MELQQQWDIWLAATFVKAPSEKIFSSACAFAHRMGMSFEQLENSGLKRFPAQGSQARFCQVSRFVCGYIKGAAEFMFDTDKNAIQKAMLLSRCSSSAVPFDKEKVRKESKEKAKDRAAFKRANDEYALGNRQREAYGRRNWSACK